MTDTTTDNLVDIENDLDKFEDVFFERVKPEEEIDEDEEVSETELETDEDEDAEAEEDDSSEDEDEDTEEDEELVKEEPKSKKGRKSFKERIGVLTAEKYEARREVEALRLELDRLRVHPQEETKTQQQPLSAVLPKEAPQPNAVDEKGEPVYPLGEFDPTFVRDLTRFTIEAEMKELDQRRAQEAQLREVQIQQQALTEHWNESLSDAEKELPDIRERLKSMANVFQNVEQNYGDFLAGLIMRSDSGPEIMYYLSENIGEAQKIVASGPAAAAFEIGKLEARLEKPVKEEKRNTKKVSVAPNPPSSRVRGSGGKFTVSPDTDDLAAFERVFYNKK